MISHLLTSLTAMVASVLAGQSSDPATTKESPAQLIDPDVIRPTDYPAEALRARAGGHVWIELKVDDQGRVTDCEVQQSSGHTTLDRATCALYAARARYRPATDPSGQVNATQDQRSVMWSVGPAGPEALDVDGPALIPGTRMIEAQDYPLEAIEKGEQGEVMTLLRVDALGKLQSCTVERSSGSTALDTRTCEAILDRGRFNPARDERGAAVAGEVRQKVTWRMHESIPELSNGLLQSTYRFDASGARSSCDVIWRRPGATGTPVSCLPDAPTHVPSRFASTLSGKPVSLVIDHLIITDDKTSEPLPTLDYQDRTVSSYRASVKLDAEGKVLECELVEVDGWEDVCASFPPSFSPVRKDGEPISATVSIVHRDRLRFENAADAGPKLLNPQELIGEGDYPAEAIASELEGRVKVKLEVSADGRVNRCSVENSSGSAVLDQAACKLVSEGARFEPALNNSGLAVASDYTRTINWQLEDPDLPVAEWTDRSIVQVSPAGEMVSCRREMEGPVPADPDEDCREEVAGAIGLPPASAGDAPVTYNIVLEQKFYPRELTSDELEAPVPYLMSRHVLRLSIGADGKLRECDLIQALGEHHSRALACESAKGPYALVNDSAGRPKAHVATMVLTVTGAPQSNT